MNGKKEKVLNKIDISDQMESALENSKATKEVTKTFTDYFTIDIQELIVIAKNKAINGYDVINKLLLDWLNTNNGNNSLPNININLDQFNAYLDSLTILEELALLHIFIFITI